MKINIYGKPYHTFEYYPHTEYTILDIYQQYLFPSFIDYIDGQFAIQILQDDKEIWITDYYGLYPIFYNDIEKKVCINFIQNMDLEVESKYIDLCKKNLDRDYYSSLPVHFLNFDDFCFYNKNMLDKKYFLTPWKNWFVLPPRSICIIHNNKITIESYLFKKETTNSTHDILVNSIIKTSKQKDNILLALSAGYDTRTLFSILQKYNICFDRYTYGIEDEYVTKNLHTYNSIPSFNMCNISNIVNDNISIMNGMGDLYVHVHEIFYEIFLKKYDFVYTGDGGNYFLGYENINIPTIQYAIGNGHYYKHLSNNINLFLPYAQKQIIHNKEQKTKQNRIKILLDIIKQNNEELLNVPCYTKYLYQNNQVSNFPFLFYYNTKYNYIKKYIKHMKGIDIL